ncbi:Fe-S cluster assembly protein SufD [Ahrensia sp. R2A130]|uniref:Fe-S cluster assembly protein SufD n=1 Tax=Ahrensia sp. R2A130 TaxID=744979 RepID=UPI0001E0B451|nr:Fe-S cluster assembly protein SufD [Ahrensia sp. R2A130]EFL90126.1 FeS assembly protein SufD [Ahrensia sp. R2A130]
MTAHSPRILTEGETSLIDAVARSTFDGDTSARKAAVDAIEANGLPTRRVEYYHYTDLRALLKGGFEPAAPVSEEVARDAGKPYPRLASDACVLHFRDGYYHDFGEALPAGISVTDGLPEAPSATSNADATSLINAAVAIGGVTVEIADGVEVDRVLGLAHAQTGAANTASGTRFAVNAGAGSKATVIERACGPNGNGYLNSSHVDITVGEGATLTYILSIEEGDAASRMGRLTVDLGKDATINLFVLNAGGKLVRQEIVFDCRGEGGHVEIAGINLVGGEAHIDVTSTINHHVANTTANELFRNVCTGRGRGVFQGQINVAQPAQLTDAKMACNTLLLSDDCDFSAKPELEIFADDVQCGHGATVTDLEPSYLFYLMARGISETRARRLLIKAFVAEAFEPMEDEKLEEALEARMDDWLDANV